MRSNTTVCIISTLFIAFVCTSCSSGPSGPQPGTPAFYFGSARQTFSAGDFLKTEDNLERALKSADFAAQAQPWSLVVLAGLGHGYMEMADNFETGARANRTDPSFFRRQSSDYRRFARGIALQLTERYRDFEQSNKDAEIALAFPFPSGSQAIPPAMMKVVKGIAPQQPELDGMQRAELSRAMILEVSRAAGAGDDSSKAASLFKAGDVKVPRATFVLAMAEVLHDHAQLFGQKKLDEPEKMRMIAEEARDALKGVPESKDVKALNDKIEKTLKPLKKT